MPPVTYPLDLSGNSPTNLVRNELHAVNEARFRDYYFIVPNFAPFYVDNFSATISVNGVTTPLREDVDFSFALPYVTGTRVTGKAMYGAITLHNLNLNGVISINYQTVGGDQIADRLHVLTLLANKAYNPRTTIWDILTNVPNAFPPTPHYQDYDQFYGQNELVNKLGEIRDAILQNSSTTQQEISNFFNNLNVNSLNSFVKKTGDTMTGPLILAGPPTDPTHAVNKHYVDNIVVNNSHLTNLLSNYATISYVDNQDSLKVNKSGDTMTGPLTLSGPPSQPSHATTKQYVDNIASNIQSQINNLQNQLNSLTSDPVTKQYVDNKINELMTIILAYVHQRS